MFCFSKKIHFFDGVRRALVLAAVSLGVCGVAAAQEGALSQLYAARPPAGSSYVRVVNPESPALAVRVAKGPVQSLSGQTPAGSYAIVQGGQNFSVQVGNTEITGLQVRPDSFQTLVLRRSGKRYAVTPVDDTTDTEDALKAELRFYNLTRACPQAALVLSPSGTAVFPSVAANGSAARSVNPVRAAVAGQCGKVNTPAQQLPALQPGDHLSLFLLGTAEAPVLVMQTNRTDAFKR